MNTNEIKAVIDMVSDKVSDSITAVQPLAEEVVRQYQARAGFGAVCGLVTTLIAAVLLAVAYMSAQRRDSLDGVVFGLTISGFTLAIVGPAVMCANYANYLAPLCGLIGK